MPHCTQSKVVFLHIMKTGGTSFRRILRSIYKESFHFCCDPTLEGIAADLAGYDAIEFHTTHCDDREVHIHNTLLEQQRWDLLDGTDIFTMLREPVDFVVSTYYYGRARRHLFDALYKEKGWVFPESIEEFLEYPDAIDGQVGYLAGKIWGIDGYKSREDLSVAKGLLAGQRTHVGIMERFSDSMRVFEAVTGHKIPDGLMPVENQNPHRPPLKEIPEWLKRLIRQRCTLDLELYEFARHMFASEFEWCQETQLKRIPFVQKAPVILPGDLRKYLPEFMRSVVTPSRQNSGTKRY